MDSIFQTTRNYVLDQYSGSQVPFIATTKPYHSVHTLRFEVVDVDTVYGHGFLVASKGQTLRFFTYGVGDRMEFGAQTDFTATDAETNLARGKSTNGAEEYIIENIAMFARGARLKLKVPASVHGSLAPITDARVVGALNGTVSVRDPGSLIAPPQVHSPANLEDALYQAVSAQMSARLTFDRKTFDPLGTCALFPQGGAASYLRANGEPSFRNRYLVPEGYLWRRDGEPDSDFQLIAELENDVVIPCNIPRNFDDSLYVVPSDVYLEIVCLIGGLGIGVRGRNA